MKISIPLILNYFCLSLLDQISLLFVGQVGNTEQLAAVGLGNMIMFLFCTSLQRGILGPLETFASQAFGRDDIRECGLCQHRCMLILTAAFIPISIVFLNTEVILFAMGMDAEISKIAHQYVVLHIPGMLLISLYNSFDIFCSHQLLIHE